MATYTAGPTYNAKDPYLEFRLTESNVSQANNSSTVNWTLILHRPSTVSTSSAKTWFIIIDGETFTSSSNIAGSGDLTLSTGSKTIKHGSDGKKTIAYTFDINLSSINWIGYGYLKELKGIGTFKLSDITTTSNPITDKNNVYIKTEDSVEYLFSSKKMQNAKKIICGTKSVSATSTGTTSIVLFTEAQFRAAVSDSSADVSQAVVLIAKKSGDLATGVSWQTCTYVNKTWYIVINGGASTTSAQQVNYMIITY